VYLTPQSYLVFLLWTPWYMVHNWLHRRVILHYTAESRLSSVRYLHHRFKTPHGILHYTTQFYISFNNSAKNIFFQITSKRTRRSSFITKKFEDKNLVFLIWRISHDQKFWKLSWSAQLWYTYIPTYTWILLYIHSVTIKSWERIYQMLFFQMILCWKLCCFRQLFYI